LLQSFLPCDDAAQACRLPWLIEYGFKHVETSGFQLEDIGFKGKAKIHLLVAVVIMAYYPAIQEGVKYTSTVQQKNYANQTTYPAVFVFCNGFII
jgi:hypothetical protein